MNLLPDMLDSKRRRECRTLRKLHQGNQIAEVPLSHLSFRWRNLLNFGRMIRDRKLLLPLGVRVSSLLADSLSSLRGGQGPALLRESETVGMATGEDFEGAAMTLKRTGPRIRVPILRMLIREIPKRNQKGSSILLLDLESRCCQRPSRNLPLLQRVWPN